MAGRVLLKKFGITEGLDLGSLTTVFDINSGGIIQSTNVGVDSYTNIVSMSAPPTVSSYVLIFGLGITSAGVQTRTATAATKVNLSQSATLGFYVNRGTSLDWGQPPDAGEELLLEYSTNNSTWTQLTKIAITVQSNTWLLQSVTIPSGAKIPSGVFLRFKQNTNGDKARRDTWAVTSIAAAPLSVNSVYTMTPTFAGTITAHIWGGGGGGGSGDKGGSGGSGSPGLYKTLTFNFNKGDTIEVAIGSGGSEGISGRPQIGGAGGSSRINVDGSSSHSFNGGTGGNGPVSGAGGGGGGATTILVNNQLVLAAGGGGAGGGAGNGGKGKSASINFNAIGSTSGDYRGQNGQTRTSDGGTGGGGGGGYPGGSGGKSNSGDSGAEAGQSGGNFPIYEATRGEGSKYYDSSYGAAGSPSAPGQNGYAVLEIVPTVEYAAASAVKVAGSWRQVAKGYVKVSGTWRQIEASYIKKNGKWQRIVSAGEQDSIIESGSNTNYGQIQRPYS